MAFDRGADVISTISEVGKTAELMRKEHLPKRNYLPQFRWAAGKYLADCH